MNLYYGITYGFGLCLTWKGLYNIVADLAKQQAPMADQDRLLKAAVVLVSLGASVFWPLLWLAAVVIIFSRWLKSFRLRKIIKRHGG